MRNSGISTSPAAFGEILANGDAAVPRWKRRTTAPGPLVLTLASAPILGKETSAAAATRTASRLVAFRNRWQPSRTRRVVTKTSLLLLVSVGSNGLTLYLCCHKPGDLPFTIAVQGAITGHRARQRPEPASKIFNRRRFGANTAAGGVH